METFVCCYNFEIKCSDSDQDNKMVQTVYDVLDNKISEWCEDEMCCKLLEFCSGCNKADEDTYIFQTDEYVTHPMTWCGCGKGLCILLKDTVKIVSKEYVKNKNPTLFTLLTDNQKQLLTTLKVGLLVFETLLLKRLVITVLDI